MNNNKSRLEKSTCTVIHTVSHNPENDTFFARKKVIEKDKCKAEGALSEKKNLFRMAIKGLPSHKSKAWINDIVNFVRMKSTSHENLRSLIGKLENVVIIIKMMGNFMKNLYALELKSSDLNTILDFHSVLQKTQKST